MDRLAAWAGEKVLWIVGILVIIIAIVGWLGYNSWRNAQNTGKVISGQTRTNAATGNIGQKAVNTTTGNQQKVEDTDAQTQQIVNNFNSFPQAKTDPGLFAAFTAGVCMYRAASGDPQCAAMQQVRPGSVEERRYTVRPATVRPNR